MGQHHDEQATSRTHWPRLGLLLVALFLIHDLFMAAEAVAMPHLAAAVPHHASRLHGVSANTYTLPNSAPTPEHPENCRIGQTAMPRSADASNGADQLLPIGRFLVAGALAPQAKTSVVWEEPRWPPGRLRALFQVYRI